MLLELTESQNPGLKVLKSLSGDDSFSIQPKRHQLGPTKAHLESLYRYTVLL